MIDSGQLVQYLFFMIVFLFSLSVHEAAHAWTAERFGDPTARYLGRVTLNPIPHIDLVGTLIFPTIAFFSGGAAVRLGQAGPLESTPCEGSPQGGYLDFGGWTHQQPVAAGRFSGGYQRPPGLSRWPEGRSMGPCWSRSCEMCFLGAILNTALAVFNMIPIPPLDGSWILPHFLPREMADAYARIRPYGFIILLLCLYLGVLRGVLRPFMQIIHWIIAF